MQYSAGMEYKGEDKFVSSIVTALNRMNSVDIGEKVLGPLISSKNSFNFKNEFPRDKNGNIVSQAEAAFVKNENGGGDILAAHALKSDEHRVLDNVSHELFHGYQYENGQKNYISNEVEAYLYGRAVYQNYLVKNEQGYAAMPWGTGMIAGKAYEDSMSGLLYAPAFDASMFKKAVENFRSGSTGNQDGTYGRGDPVPVTQNPLIKSLFPLLKY